MAITINGTSNGKINNTSFSTTTGNAVTTGDSGTITAGMLDGGQSGSQPIFGIRTWVQFQGNGTLTVNASGNVSSVTDNATGQYTVNFTTSFSDAYYTTHFMAEPTVTNAGSDTFATSETTSSVDVRHFEDGTYRDSGYSCVIILR